MARPVFRTCVGCRSIQEQRGLVRITAGPAGNVIVNPRPRQGRGAYLCPSLACFEKAWRRRVFSRALRQELSDLDEAALRGRFEAELRRRGAVGA